MKRETRAKMMMTAAFVLWVCIQPGDNATMGSILLYGVVAKIAGALLGWYGYRMMGEEVSHGS